MHTLCIYIYTHSIYIYTHTQIYISYMEEERGKRLADYKNNCQNYVNSSYLEAI